MKLKTTLISGAAIFCTAQLAIASIDQAQLPNLPAYIANAPPKPPVREQIHQHLSYLKNFYVTGSVGAAYASIGNLESTGTAKPSLISNDQSSFAPIFSIGFGYNIWHKWFFSRIEADYICLANVKYHESPFAKLSAKDFSKIDATTNTNAFMLKIYNDFTLEKRWYPYIDGGIGVAINNSSYNAAFGTNTPSQLGEASGSKTTAGLAWSVGTGVNFHVNHHLLLGVDYNFASFGKTAYDLNFSNQNPTIDLANKSYYVNSISLVLIFKPVDES